MALKSAYARVLVVIFLVTAGAVVALEESRTSTSRAALHSEGELSPIAEHSERSRPGSDDSELVPVSSPREDASVRHEPVAEPRGGAETQIESDKSDVSGGEVTGFMVAEGSPEIWALEYEGVDWEQLLAEADQISDYITAQTGEELRRMYEEGESRLLATDGVRRLDAARPNDQLPSVGFVSIDQQGQVRRYEVPEYLYPDLYALARKEYWLRLRGLRGQAMEGHENH